MEVVEDKKRWAEELVNRSLGSLGIHRRGEEVERKKEAGRGKYGWTLRHMAGVEELLVMTVAMMCVNMKIARWLQE